MPLVLDTHVLVWLIDGNDRLGNASRQLIDITWQSDLISVSAITFWEIALLQEKGRIELPEPVVDWRQHVLDEGVTEVPVSGDIGIASVMLRDFHSDPADRIITATAIMTSAQLVTADTNILSWTGDLKRHNASS
jgi:PIN domain nuclease of toxin-antitoxin system